MGKPTVPPLLLTAGAGRFLDSREDNADDSPSPRTNWRLRGMVARSVGILSILLGFVVGLYGLDHPASPWLGTALELLVTGVVAQAYGRYCSIKRFQ